MEIHLEDKITVFNSTMFGSMTMQNFIVCGTVRFGIHALDRGAAIIDIKATQMMLDMEDAASEILGFFPRYNESASYQISAEFNEKYSSDIDEYAPVMLPLREQEDLDFLLKALDERVVLIIVVFVFIMSLVLWNAGLMNGIRRYGEISVRLAMGENKIRIYSSLIAEASLLGVVGSVIGTILGLAISYYIQEYGIEMGDLMRDASMIMSSRMTAQITTATFYIGFIPDLLASVSGAVFSGIGIFKRKTAQLFKELEI
jgi:putative ABC transport system permease protein